MVFDLSGSTDGIEVKEYWLDPGDGTDPIIGSGPVVEHIFERPGTYLVKARVRDAAGHQSNAAEITVIVEDDTSMLVILSVSIGVLVVLAAVAILIIALLHRRSHHSHMPAPPHPHLIRHNPAPNGVAPRVPVALYRPPIPKAVQNPLEAPMNIPPPPRPPQPPSSPSVK